MHLNTLTCLVVLVLPEGRVQIQDIHMPVQNDLTVQGLPIGIAQAPSAQIVLIYR